ncbi:hypothetical protein [Murdochiella vaginalis]|uniref:hypothetical protein n=1 Tax=Murdochiella vaginalis TaxID=1852373 RepID=UPI0008FE16F8|nr:hypothetical protein [Murdochiella vaginalis]
MDNKKIDQMNDEAMEANNNQMNRNERNTDFYINHAINDEKPIEMHEEGATEKEKAEKAEKLSGQKKNK